jgi:hypothetical protein
VQVATDVVAWSTKLEKSKGEHAKILKELLCACSSKDELKKLTSAQKQELRRVRTESIDDHPQHRKEMALEPYKLPIEK